MQRKYIVLYMVGLGKVQGYKYKGGDSKDFRLERIKSYYGFHFIGLINSFEALNNFNCN